MNELASAPLKLLGSSDRRIPGAFRFVDAVSGLPVSGRAKIEAIGAGIINAAGETPVVMRPDEVTVIRNNSGVQVLTRAPLFEAYCGEFEHPAVATALQNGLLRLHLRVTFGNGNYLPQEFDIDLPRSLTSDATALHTSDDVSTLVISEAPFALPVTAGSFTVNGHAIVLHTDDTLAEVFSAIATGTGSAVTAAYSSASDQIVLTGTAAITLGAGGDDCNFLVAARLAANGRKIVRSHGRIAGSVFHPLEVPVFRSPSSPAESGWAVIHASVVQTGTGTPLPGVLVRAFKSPRAAGDLPIGSGMSEWREAANIGKTGELLLPVAGISRFWPGAGATVIESEQTVEFETIRDPTFTGDTGSMPNCTALLNSSSADCVTAPDVTPPVPAPASTVTIRSGGEYVITLTMP